MPYFCNSVSCLREICTGCDSRLFTGGHLTDISKDDIRVEVSLDVCLLEGLDLRAEDVVEAQEVPPCLET